MKLRQTIHKLMLLIILVIASFVSHAMPGPAGGAPPGGAPPAGGPPTGVAPCWSPPCVPIDGGIGILLAAGAFVGARKIYRSSRG